MLILSNIFLIYINRERDFFHFTDFKSGEFSLEDNELSLYYSIKKSEVFFHYIDMESITLKAKLKLKQRENLKHPVQSTAQGSPRSQTNITLTSLIILTDVLFLSQKKKNIFLPPSSVQAKAGKRLLFILSNYQTYFSAVITCLESLQWTTLLEPFCMSVNGLSMACVCVTLP